MRVLVSTFLLLLFFSSCKKKKDQDEQLINKNETTLKHVHHNVSFLDSTFGLIVGKYGIILISEDGGGNWKHRNYGNTNEEIAASNNQDLNCLQVINKHTIYVGGSNSTNAIILKSIDGGINYQTINLNVEGHVANLYFLDHLIGYALTKPDQYRHPSKRYYKTFSNHLFKTMDGGVSWIEISSPENKSFLSLLFLDENSGFLIGAGQKIYRTTNSGLTWEEQYSSENIYSSHFCIQFVSDSTGYIGGINSFFRTDDRGETWQNLGYYTPTHINSSSFSDMKFLTKDKGFFSIYSNSYDFTDLKYTLDGGYNWNTRNYTKSINIFSQYKEVVAFELLSDSKAISITQDKIYQLNIK
jgi:photosystem II stability/assembly factor-like uncharacterized protein